MALEFQLFDPSEARKLGKPMVNDRSATDVFKGVLIELKKTFRAHGLRISQRPCRNRDGLIWDVNDMKGGTMYDVVSGSAIYDIVPGLETERSDYKGKLKDAETGILLDGTCRRPDILVIRRKDMAAFVINVQILRPKTTDKMEAADHLRDFVYKDIFAAHGGWSSVCMGFITGAWIEEDASISVRRTWEATGVMWYKNQVPESWLFGAKSFGLNTVSAQKTKPVIRSGIASIGNLEASVYKGGIQVVERMGNTTRQIATVSPDDGSYSVSVMADERRKLPTAVITTSQSLPLHPSK